MTAYYNENDKFAAAWLRELIKAGVIEHGEVDQRSITEVSPADLRGFQRCHFFAGIGVWAHALREAGAENLRCWTGSCPCQPFSVSGKRKGASDERHLWPAWFALIRESRPERIFGEQVASDDGLAWLDLVSSDLENEGYACGAVDTCAAGFGAPQISQRIYFVAEADGGHAGATRIQRSGQHAQFAQNGGFAYELAAAERWRCEGPEISERQSRQNESAIVERGSANGLAASAPGEVLARHGEIRARAGADATNGLRDGGAADSLAASANARRDKARKHNGGSPSLSARSQGEEFGGARIAGQGPHGATGESGSPLGGFWSRAEWLYCRDERYRPVEPGTFPLAHGAACRVGRLRGYGNALVAPQAIGFIRAYLEEKASVIKT